MIFLEFWISPSGSYLFSLNIWCYFNAIPETLKGIISNKKNPLNSLYIYFAFIHGYFFIIGYVEKYNVQHTNHFHRCIWMLRLTWYKIISNCSNVRRLYRHHKFLQKLSRFRLLFLWANRARLQVSKFGFYDRTITVRRALIGDGTYFGIVYTVDHPCIFDGKMFLEK